MQRVHSLAAAHVGVAIAAFALAYVVSSASGDQPAKRTASLPRTKTLTVAAVTVTARVGNAARLPTLIKEKPKRKKPAKRRRAPRRRRHK